MTTSDRSFNYVPHILIPATLILLGVFCQYSGVDEYIIRLFYDASTQTWPYESLWLTAGLIHIGGKDLIVCISIGLVFSLVLSFFNTKFARYRLDLTYVILSMASGIGTVAIIKNTTHIYSPSKLLDFGGTLPHIRLFDPVPTGAPIGHAFPSGHASGAFALVSIYLLLAATGSKWKYPALCFSLTLGFIFGFTQQARGKHFFSHDLIALAICWMAATIVLYAMGVPQKKIALREAE